MAYLAGLVFVCTSLLPKGQMYRFKIFLRLGAMTHTYNPSILEGGGRNITNSILGCAI